jgi:hypothetical protein
MKKIIKIQKSLTNSMEYYYLNNIVNLLRQFENNNNEYFKVLFAKVLTTGIYIFVGFYLKPISETRKIKIIKNYFQKN